MSQFYGSKRPICETGSVSFNQLKESEIADDLETSLTSIPHRSPRTRRVSSSGSSSTSTTGTSVFHLPTDDGLSSLNAVVGDLKPFRVATIADKDIIECLITEETFQWFRQFRLDVLLCRAVYSFIIEDQIGRLALFMTLRNLPNIPAVPSANWLEWISYHYKSLKNVTYENTLFVSYFVQGLRYNPLTYLTIFKELFIREPKLRYIMFVVPPMVKEGFYDHILLLSCTRVYPDEASNCEYRCQSIYVCERYKAITKLKFRKAIVEDNDDAVNILNIDNKLVSEKLGDFYIAEEILENPNNHSIIVAEENNQTIGVIWLDPNVDIEKLNDSFNFRLFTQLRKVEDNCEYDYMSMEEILKNDSELFFTNVLALAENFESDSSEDSMEIPSFIRPISYMYKISHFNLISTGSEPAKSVMDDELIKNWHAVCKLLNSESHYSRIYKFQFRNPRNESSVFAVKLFGLDPNIDIRRIYDLLAASFSLFPNKKYAVLLVDADCAQVTNKILYYFSRCTARSRSKIIDSCYITHRSPILGNVEVKFIKVKNIPDIDSMLCQDDNSEMPKNESAQNIMEIVFDYLNNPRSIYSVMIIRCNKVPVGFIILRNAIRVDLLRKYYNVTIFKEVDCCPYWDRDRFGEILYLHVHPSFEWESYFIFREIYRLTGYFELFYSIAPRQNISNKLIGEMYHLHPKAGYEQYSIDDFLLQVEQKTYCEMKPYPIYYQIVNLAQTIRTRVDTKILIIGFDETCKSFLETLLFSKSAKTLKYTRISVILDPGIFEAEFSDNSTIAEELLSTRTIYSRQILKKLELQTIVNFISYPVTSINRCSKSVVVGENYRLYYDNLFLFASTTYGYPHNVRDNVLIPVNYAHIRCCLEGIVLQNKIELIKKCNYASIPILVYGNSKGAHACLNYLLNAGIDPVNISLIIPNNFNRQDYDQAFDDIFIQEFVEDIELKMGVTIYNNFTFVRWNLDNKNIINSVSFESKFKCTTLKCGLFISYDNNWSNFAMIEVFRKCGLITVDNFLEIDQNCQTKDKNIYAAGPFTIYNERLIASKWNHKFYDVVEIGAWLADQFVKNKILRTNPITAKQNNVPSVPKFHKPISEHAKLLNNYLVITVRRPGPYLSVDVVKIVNYFGSELVTMIKDGENVEYTRISLNENGFITSITCLTRKNKDMTYLKEFYGYHEKVLNNLKYRYDHNEIPDLLEYLHEPFIGVSVNEKFRSFLMENLELLMKSIEKEVERNIDPKKDKQFIMEYLEKNGYDRFLKRRFFDYIMSHEGAAYPFYEGSDVLTFLEKNSNLIHSEIM